MAASSVKLGEAKREWRATAALFYVEEALYRRNGLEEKLAKVGVRVKKLAPPTSVGSIDLSSVDVVIHIDGALSVGQRDVLVRRAGEFGKRLFCLDHRTSSDTWATLRGYLDARQVVDLAVAEESPRAITVDSGVARILAKNVPSAAPPAKSVADDVAATESLAAMYASENDVLREKVAAVEKDNEELRALLEVKNGWKVERERLIEENAKSIAERKKAVSELDAVRADLTARLGAAEQERRGYEARANELRAEVEQLRLRPIAVPDTGKLLAEVAAANSRVADLQAQLAEATKRIKATPKSADPGPVVRRIAAVLRAHEEGVLDDREALTKVRALGKELAS